MHCARYIFSLPPLLLQAFKPFHLSAFFCQLFPSKTVNNYLQKLRFSEGKLLPLRAFLENK